LIRMTFLPLIMMTFLPLIMMTFLPLIMMTFLPLIRKDVAVPGALSFIIILSPTFM
jgi:hypothetical protein